MSIMVWERNAIYCSPTPIQEWAKKLKNWWRNEGKRRNNVSAQMSFLGTQCQHSNILNSSTISKAIRHMTIPSESLEHGLSACQVPMWNASWSSNTTFPFGTGLHPHQASVFTLISLHDPSLRDRKVLPCLPQRLLQSPIHPTCSPSFSSPPLWCPPVLLVLDHESWP